MENLDVSRVSFVSGKSGNNHGILLEITHAENFFKNSDYFSLML